VTPSDVQGPAAGVARGPRRPGRWLGAQWALTLLPLLPGTWIWRSFPDARLQWQVELGMWLLLLSPVLHGAVIVSTFWSPARRLRLLVLAMALVWVTGAAMAWDCAREWLATDVVLVNASSVPLQKVRLRHNGRVTELGEVGPGAVASARPELFGDGPLLVRFRVADRACEHTVDGYLSAGMGGRYRVEIGVDFAIRVEAQATTLR
jgi:hypothetical protein